MKIEFSIDSETKEVTFNVDGQALVPDYFFGMCEKGIEDKYVAASWTMADTTHTVSFLQRKDGSVYGAKHEVAEKSIVPEIAQIVKRPKNAENLAQFLREKS